MASSRAASAPTDEHEALRAGLRLLLLVSERWRQAIASEVVRDGGGLTWSQWAVLDLLHESPGLAQAQVSTLLRLAPSTLSGQLRVLRSHGLVESRRDPRDTRRILLAPTPSGVRLATRLRRVEEGYMTRMLTGLDREEIDAVRRSLQHLDQSLASSGP